MFQRIICRSWLGVALLAWSAVPAGPADEPPPNATLTIDQVHQEVTALETLYYLRFTPAQMEKAKAFARDTAAKAPASGMAKVSKKLRETLDDLRAALVDATDEDRIDELSEKLEEMVEAEKATFADDFDVTDAARQKAPLLLKALTPQQVAAYLGNMADELPDPAELLTEALTKSRTLTPAKWKEYRDEIGDRVGSLVAGLDPDKAQKVSDQAVQLLIIVRSLSADEFKARQPEFARKAEAIVAADPFDVLRHIMENALAELLSNPRLSAALASRLK